jgi:hypothetical protein
MFSCHIFLSFQFPVPFRFRGKNFFVNFSSLQCMLHALPVSFLILSQTVFGKGYELKNIFHYAGSSVCCYFLSLIRKSKNSLRRSELEILDFLGMISMCLYADVGMISMCLIICGCWDDAYVFIC